MPQDEWTAAVQRPAFKEALRLWFKLGWISFGGTAAHIAIMHVFVLPSMIMVSGGRDVFSAYMISTVELTSRLPY
jgi:hypothetical protein